jgi:hypothetical protein
MTESYERALRDAEGALAEWDAKAQQADRERAKLRQTISVLKSQLGLAPDNTESLTAAILLVLKTWPGDATVPEVLERLFIMGYNAQRTSVATILSRLAKQGKIEALRDYASSAVGYGWKADLTKAERLNARKELASRAPKRE